MKFQLIINTIYPKITPSLFLHKFKMQNWKHVQDIINVAYDLDESDKGFIDYDHGEHQTFINIFGEDQYGFIDFYNIINEYSDIEIVLQLDLTRKWDNEEVIYVNYDYHDIPKENISYYSIVYSISKLNYIEITIHPKFILNLIIKHLLSDLRYTVKDHEKDIEFRENEINKAIKELNQVEDGRNAAIKTRLDNHTEELNKLKKQVRRTEELIKKLEE